MGSILLLLIDQGTVTHSVGPHNLVTKVNYAFRHVINLNECELLIAAHHNVL